MIQLVIAAKVVIHFNGIKGVQAGDQEIKIVKFADDTNIFSGDINCFARLNPILILCERIPAKK